MSKRNHKMISKERLIKNKISMMPYTNFFLTRRVKQSRLGRLGLANNESNKGEYNKGLKEPQMGLNANINKIQLHKEEELLDKVVP